MNIVFAEKHVILSYLISVSYIKYIPYRLKSKVIFTFIQIINQQFIKVVNVNSRAGAMGGRLGQVGADLYP